MRLLKTYLAPLLVGVASALVAFSLLQATVARNTERINAIEENTVPREVWEVRMQTINNKIENNKEAITGLRGDIQTLSGLLIQHLQQ